MNPLHSTLGSPGGYILCFTALLLSAVLPMLFLWLAKRRCGRIRLASVGLAFLMAFGLLAVLLDDSLNALILGAPQVLSAFELRILALPWGLAAALELICATVVLVHGRYLMRYRNTHISADAIRKAVDTLPTGVLISEMDGTVLLANPVMMELSRKMTGELLSDARRFQQRLEREAQGQLIHIRDGSVWQFDCEQIIQNGQKYNQLTAFNITEQYRITEALSEKNLHLQDIQQRVKAVAAKERSLATEREIMNARMTVHNRMGAVLLSGKYYLDHPENIIEEELLRLLEFNNRFLLSEVEQPEDGMDPLQSAMRVAGKIGVRVENIGNLPEDHAVRQILAQAVEQCASNTARHAGGNRLEMHITESESAFTAILSNNGNPPQHPVVETGGLAVLRRSVEKAGGSMQIQSDPAFRLILSIPKVKIEILTDGIPE